jgi:hypothetical protein
VAISETGARENSYKKRKKDKELYKKIDTK